MCAANLTPGRLAWRWCDRLRYGGFAAAAMLMLIGLLGLFCVWAFVTARPSATAGLFDQTKQIEETVIAQHDLILNMLLLCRTVFPAGDNGTGRHLPFPATSEDGLVSSLKCPGNNFALLWSGEAIALVPRRIPGFSAWRYVNDEDSIRIATTALEKNASSYRNLMDAVIHRIGESQAKRSDDTLIITLIK